MIRNIAAGIAFLAASLPAAQIFVSPLGDDGAAGTLAAPLKTPQAAFAKMSAGDTAYLRGGTYVFSTQVKPNVGGTAGNLCKLWAYNGEKPVFDFSGLDGRGLYISKDYWHVRGIEVKNAGSNGICLSTGGNHIIEGCIAHDNGLEGIKLTNGAHHCLVLNCDAYRNYDAPNNGENADGFAAKSGIGPGNVFRGCRAWLNSDDGWDFYGCPVSVAVDSCFAFRNGQNLWGNSSWAGDGNAFKLGGTVAAVRDDLCVESAPPCSWDRNTLLLRICAGMHGSSAQTVYLVDLTGKTVMRRFRGSSGDAVFDLSGLAQGTYGVRIRGSESAQRLVIR